MPRPGRSTSTPLPPESRRALRAMFLTLFIDLAGFSIIFPLFPSMLEHYRATEASDSLFAGLLALLENLSNAAGAPDPKWGVIVLFGGVLGSVYSLLQFLCAPFMGALSDRVGRKPVLLISISGVFISYVLWFFAGNFAMLVASRFLSGIMSANISTATAVVADVTTPQTRSRGMALVGIAFGVGFIIGPAIGGIASLYSMAEHFPSLTQYGINPYSAPAAIAGALAFVNLLLVIFRFPETLKRDENIDRPKRSVNILHLFRTVEYPGVYATNWAYFLFLLSFSGMEFSLTFLAVDRFGFTPEKNALMFLFIGIVLAGMQGSFVPRQAARLGNKAVAMHGLLFLMPGLALIGVAAQLALTWLLFVGLFVLAVGAAQATPSLTSLASLYTPAEEQGRVLGIFRSLGALARALGPLVACVLYWRLGASEAYYLGAALLVLPLLIVRKLPAVAGELASGKS